MHDQHAAKWRGIGEWAMMVLEIIGAVTSLFIANETNAQSVYAFDLWISASENYARIKANNLEETIIPIHGDAMDMPFAQDYFDTIISVDSYHYFGCKENVFAEKILPFVKKDGYVMIAVPGLKEEPQGALKEIFTTWQKVTIQSYLRLLVGGKIF